jgi:hypothetical protein
MTDWRSSKSKFWEIQSNRREHARRCQDLPPLMPGEAEQLVADYAAKRGGFTQCPPAYLVPLQQCRQ